MVGSQYRGTRVALVGPNGAGKSTVVQLILGNLRPEAGRIYADGNSYEEIDLVRLRRAIGVVMQEPMLFSGTILENITYGCPDADADEVARAARLSTADSFIQRFPNGYQTVVGEHGFLLSGGERQRIALARAFLRRPKLLILDEHTNHLDAQSVSDLFQNLHELDDAPSIRVISHDATVVRWWERA